MIFAPQLMPTSGSIFGQTVMSRKRPNGGCALIETDLVLLDIRTKVALIFGFTWRKFCFE